MTDILVLVKTHIRKGLDLSDDYPLSESDDLDLLPGADSVRLMRVVAALESELGVQFDDAAVRRVSTVGDVVNLVRQSAS